MSARCETCTHWKFAEKDWEFESLVFGKCAAVKQREDVEREACEAAGIDHRWDDGGEEVVLNAMREAKAIAVDGSGYYAALRTAADFGCVLHQAVAS